MLFCLVHGGQHGAWCFERLALALRKRGHGAAAVDLPIDDTATGASRYADVVVESLSHVVDEVVVVGHSMGGLVIPLVAQRRPVARLVFLCAAIPEPGRSHMQVRQQEAGESPSLETAAMWASPGDRHMASREDARAMFYNDCVPWLQDWALHRLRPQSRLPLTEVTPLREWPDVPLSIVNTTEDRCIPPAVAEHNAWRLFQRMPHFYRGGHVPFLAQPDLFADILVDLASGVAVERGAAS